MPRIETTRRKTEPGIPPPPPPPVIEGMEPKLIKVKKKVRKVSKRPKEEEHSPVTEIEADRDGVSDLPPPPQPVRLHCLR